MRYYWYIHTTYSLFIYIEQYWIYTFVRPSYYSSSTRWYCLFIAFSLYMYFIVHLLPTHPHHREERGTMTMGGGRGGTGPWNIYRYTRLIENIYIFIYLYILCIIYTMYTYCMHTTQNLQRPSEMFLGCLVAITYCNLQALIPWGGIKCTCE